MLHAEPFFLRPEFEPVLYHLCPKGHPALVLGGEVVPQAALVYLHIVSHPGELKLFAEFRVADSLQEGLQSSASSCSPVRCPGKLERLLYCIVTAHDDTIAMMSEQTDEINRGGTQHVKQYKLLHPGFNFTGHGRGYRQRQQTGR